MRIIWIVPYFFVPPDTGSKIRVYNLLKYTSRHRNIDAVCFYEKGLQASPSKEALREARKLVTKIDILERGSDKKNRLSKVFAAIFNKDPLYITNFKVAGALEKIREALNGAGRIVMQADEIYTAQYLVKIEKVSTILILHNIDSLFFLRLSKSHPNYFRKAFFFLQYLKMRSYEKKIIPRIDRCFCVSDSDKEYADKLFKGKVNIDVLPNGVDSKAMVPLPHNDDPVLFFVGVLRYAQNSLSIEWFLKHVYKHVLNVLKDTILYVAGEGVSNPLKSMESTLPVKFLGYVNNVCEWYRKSMVSIAPIRVGSGTKLKILESMAYGRPVVTTSIGAEGLKVRDGHDIMIADDANDFAIKTIKLLTQPELYMRIALNGRKTIETTYDWDIIGAKLEATYRELETEK